MIRRRRGGRAEEPEDRRRPSVPPLHGPAGADRRIRDGEMGQIQLVRAYRMESGGQMARRSPAREKELL